MTEEAIELHDSTLTEVTTDGRDVVLRLRPGYVHRWSTDLKEDVGSGWTQDLDLVIQGATVWPRWPTPEELPSWLAGGSLRVGLSRWENLIPLAIVGVGPVEFRVEGSGGLRLMVRGIGIQITARGEASYVEPSPWCGWSRRGGSCDA